jgi:hypothetical protein
MKKKKSSQLAYGSRFQSLIMVAKQSTKHSYLTAQIAATSAVSN